MLVKDLIVTGDARIIGNLYTNAELENNSSGGSGGSGGLTYRLEKSGSTISLVGSDGSRTSVTDTDTNTTNFLPLTGGTVSGNIIANSFKGDTTDAGIRPSDSNEINLSSNANYIYIGYDNRLNSSGAISNYKFGTHSGAAGSTKGIIECGEVIENGTSLSSKYTTQAWVKDYINTALVNGRW